MVTSLALNALFVLSVILIWFMVGYQFLLWLLGYVYGRRSERERRELDASSEPLPPISILLPAHNEEVVIERTLAALLSLEYPADRLEIIVINDASTDRTRELVLEISRRVPQVKLLDVPPEVGGKGKAAALNRGLLAASHDLIAIYDADNIPEPASLRHLARQIQGHPEYAAVLGKFRTLNRKASWLTRFINIEGISFQWIVQAGRWVLLRFCSLPGTNYIIRKPALLKVGGWDEDALTEDAELTLRLYEAGYLVKFVPYAVTWEQEPETIRVWWRQRNRWVRGYNYLIRKFALRVLHLKPRALRFELAYSLAIYYVFFAAILISDLLFVLGWLGLILIPVPGPYKQVWIFAFLLYVLELVLALAQEHEDSAGNVALSVLMYLTYSQLWIPVVLNAFYDDFIIRKEVRWTKTERFKVSEAVISASVKSKVHSADR